MEKQYTQQDVIDILVQNANLLLPIEETQDPVLPDHQRLNVYISGYVFPVLPQNNEGNNLGIVDDFSYSHNRQKAFPIIELEGKKYLEVDIRFLKKYISTEKLDDGFNVTYITFEEALLEELNNGSVVMRK